MITWAGPSNDPMSLKARALEPTRSSAQRATSSADGAMSSQMCGISRSMYSSIGADEPRL